MRNNIYIYKYNVEMDRSKKEERGCGNYKWQIMLWEHSGGGCSERTGGANKSIYQVEVCVEVVTRGNIYAAEVGRVSAAESQFSSHLRVG